MIGGNSVRGGLPRQWGVLASVVLVHLGVLWWLQQGLSRELLPVITPITLISVPLDRPAPVVLPEPVPTRAAPAPRQQPIPEKPAQPSVSASPPQPAAPTLTSPNSPGTAAPTAESPVQAPVQAPTGTTAMPPPPGSRAGPSGAGPAAPSVVLPSAQAAYLHNPAPAYPPMSRRLAEQGRVMVRVLIGTDGLPQKAELQAGSGYDRLDRAALDAVMRWRFVPGRRGDVPEAMWVSVPIVFNLE
jgi:protein TonB